METKKVLIKGKAVDLEDTKLKFGWNQIKAPTPPWATKIFRVILYTATGTNILIAIFTDIPPDIAGLIAKYSLQAIAAVHAITKLMGLEIEKTN